MELTWYGHSCFLLKTSSGKKILMDPFHLSTGYIPFKGSVDIVTLSHNHFDHSDLTNIDGNPQIINSIDDFTFDSIKIKGIPSFHDNENGIKRGTNIIFLFEVDDLRICHLGDLGHNLNTNYEDLLNNIDILMIPVGGHYTINGRTASLVCNLLSPKYVIPMHYKTPNLSFLLNGPEEFLMSMKNAYKISNNTLHISDLPINSESTSKVLLLSTPKI